MRRTLLHILPVLSSLAALPIAAPAAAQHIRGTVVLQGTQNVIADATVTLLDAQLTEVATARTNETGIFVFSRLRAGRYALQAQSEGIQTALTDVTVATDTAHVALELPSPVVVLAMTCGAAPDTGATTLVGLVHDRNSGVALPTAKLELTWEGGRAESSSDRAGYYRFCAVPAGRELTIAVHALGQRVSSAIRLTSAPVNRLDMPIDIGALSFETAVTSRRPAQSSNSGTVIFLLRDATNGAPLQGAAVWLGRAPGATFSNASGIVRFDRVPPGENELRIEMIGYGSRSAPIQVAAAEEIQVMVRVPPKPVALEPIAIHSTMRSEFRTPREASTRVDILAGRELAFAEARAANVADVLRGRFAGLFIHEGAYSTVHNPELERIVCVESVRRLDRLRSPPGVREPFCEMVTIIYDGVPTFNAGAMLRNLSVRDIESLEYLGPLEAGIRYGVRASQSGALVIWSRGQGPHKSPERHKS
jgi:hypothetical protein